MKYFLILITLLTFSSESFAENFLPSISRQFMDLYIEGEFDKAAKLLYCPKQYTQEKLKEEQEELANEFLRMSKEFGKAQSYKLVSYGLYTTVVFSCGSIQDHGNINVIGQDIIDIKYSGNQKGRIQIYYIEVSNRVELGLVGIGEATITPGSWTRQKQLYDEVK